MSQIRLNRTPELDQVLAYLRGKYLMLSEAEIIKVALAEKYKKEAEEMPMVDEETEKLIAQGLEDVKKGRHTDIHTEKELHDYLKSL